LRRGSRPGLGRRRGLSRWRGLGRWRLRFGVGLTGWRLPAGLIAVAALGSATFSSLAPLAALVGAIRSGGRLQLDRLDGRRIGGPEQRRHRASRCGTGEEADREQRDDPAPHLARSRECALIIVAGHALTKVRVRGEPSMRFT
jgi:hypothetical protein